MTQARQEGAAAVAPPDQTRLERDRHVAFAFAAADLLVETNLTGDIVAASGAGQRLLGRPVRSLPGLNVKELVSKSEQPIILRLLKQVRASGRVDPISMALTRPDGASNPVLIGGCHLPNIPKSIFLSATALPVSVSLVPRERDDVTGLMTKDAFLETAERSATAGGSDQLRLLQLDGLAGVSQHLAPEQLSSMMEEIGAALRMQSVGGDSAGRLAEESFGYVAKAGSDGQQQDQSLLKEISDVFRSVGLAEAQIAPRLASVTLSADGLNEADVGRSIAYAMNSFIKNRGNGPVVNSLASGLAEAVRDTVTRVAETREMIEGRKFSLVYQPVVNILTKALHHYEVLSRFEGTKTTFETITFSEDIGLVAALDMAVCEQAVDALKKHSSAMVAINLSGRSIQNEAFRQAFGELIRPLNDLRTRLLFELTESVAVEDLEVASSFLRWVRKLGHAVCLDDFGAGAAAYSYLRRFDVDFVKIDGPFLKAALTRTRERALIHSICVLCAQLGCKVIGEMIETEDGASLATSLGIGYGQGWLFGKPVPELPAAIIPGRRKGSSETWL